MDSPDSHGSVPALLSAPPLCLLEGIIHLALSLYTVLSRAHTHTSANTPILSVYMAER